MEEREGDGAQGLKEQIARQGPQHQGDAAHGQILQEEEPGDLPVLQADQDIGAQLPAAPGEHEAGGVLDQPADDAHHQDAGQDDNDGHGLHHAGQGKQLLGEHKAVERIDQGGGHDDGDEVDQIILGLPPGVAHGELR